MSSLLLAAAMKAASSSATVSGVWPPSVSVRTVTLGSAEPEWVSG